MAYKNSFIVIGKKWSDMAVPFIEKEKPYTYYFNRVNDPSFRSLSPQRPLRLTAEEVSLFSH